MQETINDFQTTIEQAFAAMTKISEAESLKSSGTNKWSRKEILGHLIDSASNNHQRFVRAQIVPTLSFPGYDQPSWVGKQAYQKEPWSELIQLWKSYNLHLLHIMKHAAKDSLNHVCKIAENEPVSLQALMEDYVVHMKHHLNQIADNRLTGHS